MAFRLDWGLEIGVWGLRQVCQLECVDANSTVDAVLQGKVSLVYSLPSEKYWSRC